MLLSRSLQAPIVPRMRGNETEIKKSLFPSPGRVCYYDVFLSFRGEDTRKTVASHLHRALVARGIPTFKDDAKIGLGDTIPETLQGAIRSSRFAVVIISKNYATSRWCLEELRLIMELELKKKIGVIPVFYEVAPSEVRNLRGNFALTGHRSLKMAKMIPKWKEALRSIADRQGTESRKCKDEATMVTRVVRHISRKLFSTFPMDLEAIVGVEAHMEGLRPLLDMDSKNDEVRMIGIWGMGGIGKTSIAKHLYEELKHQFSTHHCFMGGVSCKGHDILDLQNQLLSNITGEEDPKLRNLDQGVAHIKLRLSNLKALIVLDDVDDRTQLRLLARDASWFGRGSRIIITTRDRSLLSSCKVYKVNYLDDDKALQLFKRIALQGAKPPSSSAYKDLSNRVSRLSQGLPLALEDFGFDLRDKSLEEWQDALKSFEEAPYEKTMKVLKISYDKLDKLSKTAFLLVACLFNGEHVQRVTKLLEQGGERIRVLVEKSLIDISIDGCIVMHPLLEQLGRQIVGQESGDNPAQQRILWHQDDIYTVLKNNAGTGKCEGVALDVSVMKPDFDIKWDFFKPMHNLRFLKIYKHSRGLESRREGQNLGENLDVTLKLRLLHWDAYPFTTLPTSISPGCLIELNMCNSKLTTLWNGTPRLLLLRRLNLTGSKHLIELPDLQEAVSLEELILEGCISLKQIPKAISRLSRLQELDVSNCDGLKNLRIKIRESEPTLFKGGRLRVRSVCRSFYRAQPFLEESQGLSATDLSIKGNLQIELMFLEGFAEHLSFISEKQISPEQMMSELTPYGFLSLDIMRFNYSEKNGNFKCSSFSGFPWLLELKLINLNIQEIPEDIHHMQVLEKLDLSGNDFTGLPSSMIQLSQLKNLGLCNCRNLQELPELYQVERLTLSDCTNLRKLVNLPHAEQFQGRDSLRELWLDNCNNVDSLSDELSRFTKLTYLDLSSHDFETLPSTIKDLTSLVTLCLNNCKKLKSMEELPMSLKRLNAHGCNSLKDSSLPIKHSIDHLDLSPCPHRDQDQESSQITRFPAGRYSKEVPVCACACFQETTILSTDNKLTPSLISILSQRLKAWLCAFARCTLVAGLAILVVTGIDCLTSTNMSIHIYLFVAIFLYRTLYETPTPKEM